MLDADESIFFGRELEHVKAKTYDKKYAQLKARTLFPVSSEAGPGAESITYEQYDSVGIAKVIGSYADDLPRADVKGKQFTSIIKSLGSSYGYNIQEIRAAQMAGKPLAQRKADAAKKAILTREDQIAFSGDSTNGILGFLTNPNIPLVVLAADGTGATTTFSTKTADKILRDLNKVVNSIVELTKEVEIPDTMLLPTEIYNLLKNTPWSTANDGKSVLKLFLENNDYIKNVFSVPRMKGAGAGGLDRMAVYRRDPDALTLEIPQDFEMLEEQSRGLEYVTPCHSRIGGVIVYYPLSIAFADGI
jgi:hypothetical protein